jgi:hypothetical protein
LEVLELLELIELGLELLELELATTVVDALEVLLDWLISMPWVPSSTIPALLYITVPVATAGLTLTAKLTVAL